jgi:hypothetical protein
VIARQQIVDQSVEEGGAGFDCFERPKTTIGKRRCRSDTILVRHALSTSHPSGAGPLPL